MYWPGLEEGRATSSSSLLLLLLHHISLKGEADWCSSSAGCISISLLGNVCMPFEKQRTEANEVIKENSQDAESEQPGAPSEIIHAFVQMMVILFEHTLRETGEVKTAHFRNPGKIRNDKRF